MSDHPSPQRINEMMWGYSAPIMIEAGVHHHLFDILDTGPKTLEQITAATKASPRGVRILLNGLVGLNLLAKAGEQYAITPEAAAFLVQGKPGFLGGMLGHLVNQLISNWLQLKEVVQTGKPATAVNQQGPGGDFFAKFVEDIFPMSHPAATALADAMAAQLQSIASPKALDIAAGSGVWGIALAKKFPALQVTAVDWPAVLPVTQKVAAKHGVGARLKTLPGDLLEIDYGTGYHIATLGHILHSEGEPRSRKLISKVFTSLAPGGTIAISEFTPNDTRTAPPMPLIFAVNMLVNTDVGDTFTFTEISQWLKQAGFEKIRQLEAPAPSPLILADKPGK